MATLEKIRSKQGLLFGVLIVALFLFIITMAGDPRDWFRSFQKHEMISAGNIGVTIEENSDFKNRLGSTSIDPDSLNQLVLGVQLMEKLLNEQYDQIGLTVPNDSLVSLINQSTNPQVNIILQSIAGGLNLPESDAAQIVNIIIKPSLINQTPAQLDELAANISNFLQQRYGLNVNARSMAELWTDYVEKPAEQAYQAQVYQNLLSGLFTYNKLDAQTVYNNTTKGRNIKYVTTPLSAIPDSTVTASEADIKAKWEETKYLSSIDEPTTSIRYIYLPVQPSQEDFAAADEIVDATIATLKQANSNEDLDAVTGMNVTNIKATLSDLNADDLMRTVPAEMWAADSVYRFMRQGNTLNVIKVLDVTSRVDSVNVSMALVASLDQAVSIADSLNNGQMTFKSLPQNVLQSQEDVWQRTIFTPDYALTNINKAIAQYDATKRPYVYVDSVNTAQGTFYTVNQLNKHEDPVKVYDINIYSLVVDPSNATMSQLRTRLSDFIAANHTAKDFVAAADTVFHGSLAADVTASTPALPSNNGRTGLKSSREIVRWAMNADKGDVSRVFSTPSYYAVAAVVDKFDGDYIPATTDGLHQMLETQVKADKKAAKIGEKYNGNSIDEAATALNANVLTINNNTMSTPRFGVLYGDVTKITGTAAGAEVGKLYGPYSDNINAVYFVVTEDAENPTREFDESRDGETFKRQFLFNTQRSDDIRLLMLGKRKVKNHTLDFEGER